MSDEIRKTSETSSGASLPAGEPNGFSGNSGAAASVKEKPALSWRKRLKGWQRLCLTLLSAAVCGLLVWIFCEWIAKPVYTDSTARVSLRAEGYNFDTVMRFYGDEGLKILDGVQEELAGEEYLNQVAQRAGVDAKAADLKEKLSFSLNVLDVEMRTIDIDASWPDSKAASSLALAAAEELGELIYLGEETAEGEGPVITEQGMTGEARKVWPITGLYVAVACLIGLIAGFAVFSGLPGFDTFLVVFFTAFTFICVFPFYYLFINTVSDNSLVASGQINFFPRGIHFTNYARILGEGDLLNAVIVTVSRTVIGTAVMVITSAWAGYMVTRQKMWHRSFWYRALVVTMYFNAGLIPWYVNMQMLGLTGNFLAYIIPGMVAPYNIILVKTYIESIPASLEESAIIDGASSFKVFSRIILPLSVPILATIAIFGAVGNWNSFQDSLLLMSSKPELYTLQHRLYVYLNQTTSINTEQISEQMAQNLLNNSVTTKYTIAMITIIPILLVYPFMQRFFVKGIMLGAVKG